MRKKYSVIIVGTGIAGLTTAIQCRQAGLDVLVVTKNDRMEETNTNYAQGGIIAEKKESSPESLERDILNAGCDYNNKEAVSYFSKMAPPLVFSFLIEKTGVQFSRAQDGTLDYTDEAAHSERRILHFEDHTGDTIQKALILFAQKCGVEIKTGFTAIDLITNNHHSLDPQELYRTREVFGVYALDNHAGTVHTLLADAVVLATGGIGNIYQFTTNPSSATGDGISMAFRAGADIINSEFVQFHPTALFHKDIKRFLISESLRGEGAKLVDKQGRSFMEKYSPQKELAPRDVVTRAIYEEMAIQESDYMFLDLASHYRGEKPISERFSKIYETCLSGGIDITKDPIPIVPAAHYFCGGIKVDLSGQTSLKRLYAIGEVSCTGLHGANRLASTSLLEGLLWGKEAADQIIRNAKITPTHSVEDSRFNAIPDWKIPSVAEHFEHSLIYQDWNVIKMTMWNHAGIIRTRKGLERAQADLNYHAHRITRFYREAVLDRDMIELRNGVVTAQIIVESAIHNEKSIGCHFRRN